jgi:hypothetical protein
MIATTPSYSDYHTYLQHVHGINCEKETTKCIHTSNDLMSEHIRSLPFYMTAETTIFNEESNKIRVIGIFGHFFILENSLKPLH